MFKVLEENLPWLPVVPFVRLCKLSPAGHGGSSTVKDLDNVLKVTKLPGGHY